MTMPELTHQVRRPSLPAIILAAFVLMSCLKVWMPAERMLEPARAQIPNPATDRRELLQIGRRTNELLTDIKRILESKTLHVTLERADNPAGAEGVAPRHDR